MDHQEPKSKSAIKREFKSLQEFVRTLVEIPDSQLKKLPLSNFITDEIVRARSMSKGALKRQIGYISKNMADEATDEARELLAALKQPQAKANAHFHQLEKWRDQLIGGDDAIVDTLVSQYQADRQKLRQLVRNSEQEAERQLAPRAARQLFQYLRKITSDQEVSEPL
ncbi:MAG: ribosome biogenesis factor YjgA [Arenicellales bacterium]